MTWPSRALLIAALLLPVLAFAQPLPELTAEVPISAENPTPTGLSASGFASADSHSLVLLDRSGDLYAAILNEEGTTQKTIPVALSGRSELGVAVFWNGETYVVLYTAVTRSTDRISVLSVRVSPEGVVERPVHVAAAVNRLWVWAFSDGDSTLLLWGGDIHGSSALFALKLDRDGEPAGDSWLLFDKLLSVDAGLLKGNDIFIAATHRKSEASNEMLAGAVFEGRPWEPYVVPEVILEDGVGIAAEKLLRTREGYLLIWAELPKYFGTNLSATVLTESAPGKTWSLGVEPWGAPSVEQFPGGTLIVFSSWDGYPYGRYTAAVFDENAIGSTLSLFPVSVSGFFTGPPPRLAWDGHRVGMVWAQRYLQKPLLSNLVYVDPVTRTATPEAAVGLAAEIQWSPLVAPGGSVDLIAWSSPRTDRDSTRFPAVRLDTSGTPIDATPFDLDVVPTAIASNGSIFLVVSWGDLRAQRVAEDGIVFKETPFQIAGDRVRAEFGVDVVWTGEHFLVAWTEGETFADTTVQASRVRSDGTVLDPHGFDLLPGLNARHARLASDGENVLLVWATAGREIQAMLVSRDGAPRSTISHVGWDIEQRDPLLGREPTHSASVAFNGSSYLVTWKTKQGALWATRVSRDGDVAPAPLPVHRRPVRVGESQFDAGEFLIATEVGGRHSLVGIDGGWLLAWDTALQGNESDVLWMRVDEDGALSSAAPIATNPDVDERAPSLMVRDGVVTIAYERALRNVTRSADLHSRFRSRGLDCGPDCEGPTDPDRSSHAPTRVRRNAAPHPHKH
ncbi:MAG: hypothetical protein ACYC7A_21715 [Thermoanaerobaculia bacterium]